MIAGEDYGIYISKILAKKKPEYLRTSRWKYEIAEYGAYEGIYDFITDFFKRLKPDKPVPTAGKPTTPSQDIAIAKGVEKLPVLRHGSRGYYVKLLQSLLNKLGYGLTVDGIFGKKTYAAVIDFQKKYGLTVDGIVGKQTWTALFKATGTVPPVVVTPPEPAPESRPEKKKPPAPMPPPAPTPPVKAGMLDFLLKNWILLAVAGAGLITMLLLVKKEGGR